MGLEPGESFEVRWNGIDSDLNVMMSRDVFTPREARAADLFKQEHTIHNGIVRHDRNHKVLFHTKLGQLER